LILLQASRKIVTTKNSSEQLVNEAKERKKTKRSDRVSGGESTSGIREERAQVAEEEKGKVANAKEEERQQAELTRRVAGTVAPYVEPPSDKAPRELLEVPRRRGTSASGTESDGGRGSQSERAKGNHWASH
jgi:hypothetical protein